jgi:hypothetical protein
MEYAMRYTIPFTALGLALVAGSAAANAQTAQTVQTTETVRTVRIAPSPTLRRQVVTTRTVTRQLVPAPNVIAGTVSAAPRPLYDEVTSVPLPGNDWSSGPLYDEVSTQVAPAAVSAPAPVVQDQYSAPLFYRYVYEPDRILVIDPNTGSAVQAIPR